MLYTLTILQVISKKCVEKFFCRQEQEDVQTLLLQSLRLTYSCKRQSKNYANNILVCVLKTSEGSAAFMAPH